MDFLWGPETQLEVLIVTQNFLHAVVLYVAITTKDLEQVRSSPAQKRMRSRTKSQDGVEI
jgi:hypothetical protein